MTDTETTQSQAFTMEDIAAHENLIRESKGIDALHASMENDLTTAAEVDPEFAAFMQSGYLKNLFFLENWVFITVDVVAMKISNTPMKVMTSEVIDGQLVKKPIEGHPLQAMIDYPNKFQAYSSWCYNTIVDLVLTGNSIQWYASASNQLIALPTDTITMEFAQDGSLEGYAVAEAESDTRSLTKLAKFPVDEVVHLRRPNPGSLLWGLSPFIAGRKSILFQRYSQDYLNSFYQKGAMPGFAIKMDKDANERVAMRIIRSFENAYTGRRNMRRTMVLPKGTDIKEMTPTLANQNLKEYINLNREDIIALLKVPKHELSLQEAGSLGSEEAKTSLKNFWHATLLPMMSILEGELSRFFVRRGFLTKDQFIEFDKSNIDALQEDQSNKADYAEKLLKTHTLNEVRKSVYNLPPVEGGDVVSGFNQPQFAPMPFGLSKQPISPVTAQQPADQPQQSEPVMAEETLSVDPGQTATAAPSKMKASKESLSTFLKSADGWFDKREAKIRADAAKGQTIMEKRTLKMFADMAATIIGTTKKFLKEKSWDQHIATKAEDGQPKASLVKKNELRRRLRNALDKFESAWIDDYREALVARVDVGYNAALDVPFNMPSKTEIAGLRARGRSVREDALEERAGRVFSYMNETTIGRVFRTIENGIDEGKTVQQIADSLRDKFSEVEEIGARAMMIARTETLTAVSLGQAAAMADAATIVPDLQKMWLTAKDERVRDSHEELDGDIVPWDGTFDNGLKFPRDPAGEAADVVNCRCAMLIVPKDQMSEIDSGLLASDETKE